MVPEVGPAPVGGQRGAPVAGGARPAESTRREVARRLLASAAGVALAPAAAACERPPNTPDDSRRTGAFDETYRGRHIRGVEVRTGRRAATAQWEVTIDGRPLDLMRRADGSWLTMVDHYRSYPTPLAAARAAVDELGPDEHLRDLAPGPMGGAPAHGGGGHGVHA
ncbi:tyrosinase co-factor MelC1 [Streptomyces puniciscabiei]|uniref:Tyrosinase co-factor MelC1 n=1 Tax=Streptomyces puniciscabiei TaxID=164348 RepID=A0A542UIQ5_9ACTN|nr:tyrosinase family oxidase copper chaperone [Streptomyces puniciscabiei]TQK98949.1 tyrosinase co-factor MelC1 [Streptomyces puniciscabiei]